MKKGDIVTFEGCYPTIHNRHRRWWQIWKPRRVVDYTRLQRFKVVDTYP